jgi:hypothetical protein
LAVCARAGACRQFLTSMGCCALIPGSSPRPPKPRWSPRPFCSPWSKAQATWEAACVPRRIGKNLLSEPTGAYRDSIRASQQHDLAVVCKSFPLAPSPHAINLLLMLHLPAVLFRRRYLRG